MVAGEEEAGTLEVLLVTPVSTRKLVMHKPAALAVSIVMLGILLFGVTMISSQAFGMDSRPATLPPGLSPWFFLASNSGRLRSPPPP